MVECSLAATKNTTTSHEHCKFQNFLKDFLAKCSATKKCNNCSTYLPTVQQDAHNKKFESHLSKMD